MFMDAPNAANDWQVVELTLKQLTELVTEAKCRSQSAGDAIPSDLPPLAAQDIRSIIKARRLRDRYFPEHLFADPAWDMLLDLWAAEMEGRRVCVSSLCIAACVPPTTALRWIRQLSEAGLVGRSTDRSDGRRNYVRLSENARASFEAYWADGPSRAVI